MDSLLYKWTLTNLIGCSGYINEYTIKGWFTKHAKNMFSHFSLVVFSHADRSRFLDISV